MRLTGYDPLRRRRKGEKTYRENRQNNQTDLTRIFWIMEAFLDLVSDIWTFESPQEVLVGTIDHHDCADGSTYRVHPGIRRGTFHLLNFQKEWHVKPLTIY